MGYTQQVRPVSNAAERMRRTRGRRRDGFRCVGVEIHVDEVERLIELGLLEAEHRHDPEAIAEALYKVLEFALWH
jgi:hypothetical protein